MALPILVNGGPVLDDLQFASVSTVTLPRHREQISSAVKNSVPAAGATMVLDRTSVSSSSRRPSVWSGSDGTAPKLGTMSAARFSLLAKRLSADSYAASNAGSLGAGNFWRVTR
jgi:hypothetical protein